MSSRDDGDVERDVSFASARARVAVAFAIGVAVGGVVSVFGPWEVGVSAGWIAAAAVFVIWVWANVWGADGKRTRALAQREDDSRAASDVVLVLAAAASLVAVGFGLLKAGQAEGAGKGATTALGVVAVVLAWAAIQTVFTLRYADLYYRYDGGITFNEKDTDPDYRDFLYLALTVGMTYQVSDTNITDRTIRRTVTRHALLSFVFGTAIIAMVINVVAELLKR